MSVTPRIAVGLLLAAAACGGDSTFPSDAIAIRANSELTVGHERVLVGVGREDGTRLGSNDHPVTVDVAPEDDASAVQSSVGLFVAIVPGSSGLYRAEFEFDRAGIWVLTVVPAVGEPLPPIFINVLDASCREPAASTPCAPRVGEKAPALATPTLASAPIEDLTTDADPDERFYSLSLDAALRNGRPTVIVFSTPAFCQTAACGPLLDSVKSIVDGHPEVDFVHIEVYTGLRDDEFLPDADHLAPAVIAYDLQSEPWVFVTDASGTIVARFEGVLDVAELAPHLG